jgi:hypothetical protein
MIKRIFRICIFVILCVPVFAQQKSSKLTKEESSKMTRDQRVVHEVNRKSKGGKKDVSWKKKVRIDKKQARKSRRTKQPKRKK